MARRILLVEDQADVRSLLHSALGTLRAPDIETFEAASAEQAVREFARRPIDLLVLKDKLPDIPGIELMHGMRAGRPDLRVIMITEAAERRRRDEILNAGAAAVFEKPIPLGDFLGAVERSLGLSPTIFPADEAPAAEARMPRIADLLANLRQDMRADGALLINDRGLVAARAGGIPDPSMEVSLVSGLAALFSAGLKVARTRGDEIFHQHWVIHGSHDDLILMPVNAHYALLLAGTNLGAPADLVHSVAAVREVASNLEKSLGGIETTLDTPPEAESVTAETALTEDRLDDLWHPAGYRPPPAEELNAFWDDVAASSTDTPSGPDTISFDEARKLGLTPEDDRP